MRPWLDYATAMSHESDNERAAPGGLTAGQTAIPHRECCKLAASRLLARIGRMKAIFRIGLISALFQMHVKFGRFLYRRVAVPC